MILIDSDVLIWYLRGNAKAGECINNLTSISISSVVYMELLQGMRNRQELNLFKSFIRERGIECLPITSEITCRAIYFLESFSLSHGLRMADALIAATADLYGEPLLTANDAHYKMISSLSIQTFRPN